MQRTRLMRLALGVLVAVILLVGPGEFGFASRASGGLPRGDDICKLLTKKQVVRVLGRGLGRVSSPIPSDDECIWQTRPAQGRPVATVQLSAESLDEATEGYPDYLTALEEGTTADYSPVSGLGDEAYAVRSVVTPSGSADGLNLVKDDVVLELQWTSEPAKTGSRRYDAIVASMQKALAKL